MEVAEHVVGGGTLGRGCGAQCRHRPGPLGLPDGDDAHDQLCRQDCRVRHWGGLQPQLVFSVGKQAVSACLLCVWGVPHWLGRSFQKVSFMRGPCWSSTQPLRGLLKGTPSV